MDQRSVPKGMYTLSSARPSAIALLHCQRRPSTPPGRWQRSSGSNITGFAVCVSREDDLGSPNRGSFRPRLRLCQGNETSNLLLARKSTSGRLCAAAFAKDVGHQLIRRPPHTCAEKLGCKLAVEFSRYLFWNWRPSGGFLIEIRAKLRRLGRCHMRLAVCCGRVPSVSMFRWQRASLW